MILEKMFLFLILFLLHSFARAQLDVQSLVTNAITSNKREVILPAGTFKVNNPIWIGNANNLKIRGSNTKLIFDPTISNRYWDIQVERANFVTIQDLEIDYDPLPFTQGKVIFIDSSKTWFDVAIHSGYSRDSNRFKDDCYIHIHDTYTKIFKQEGEMMYSQKTESISQGLRVFIKGSTDYSNLKINDLVSIGQSGFRCAISLWNTRNTLIDNVQIFSAPGCGILENGGGGSVFNNVRIQRGPKPTLSGEDRLLSVNRDGFHLNGPNGGTIVKNSYVEFNGDDAINIRSEMSKITYVSGNIISFAGYTNFETGSNLDIYNEKDLTLKDQVCVQEHQMGFNTARLDRTSNINVGDKIVSPQHTQGFKILNNTFSNIDARGIVATGSNIYIEGNKITRSTMGGIWLGAELGYYDEGGFADNVFIRWNILNDVSYSLRGRRQHTTLLGAISVVNEFSNGYKQSDFKYKRPNRNVVIAENEVNRPGLAALFLNSIWNARVCENNFFNDNNLYFNNAGTSVFSNIDSRYSIVIHDASTIKIYKNWVKIGQFTRDMRVVTDSDAVTDPDTNPCKI